MMTTVVFYEDLLKDPFIRELNGSPHSEFTDLWTEIRTQVKNQIVSQFQIESLIAVELGKGKEVFQDGGDVDTVHNVYNNIEIKNSDAQKRLKKSKSEYDSNEFHKNQKFNQAKAELHRRQNNGEILIDQSTGKVFKSNQTAHLDHIIPGKSFSEDPGVALSGLDSETLANQDYNFAAINSGVNLSKQSKSNEEYVAHNDQRVEQARANIANLNPDDPKYEEKLGRNQGRIDADPDLMVEMQQRAEKIKNETVAKSYYQGTQFKKDTLKAAGKRGVKNMMQAVWGVLFYELQDVFFTEVLPLVKNWSDYKGKRIAQLKEIMARVKKHLIDSMQTMKSQLLTNASDGFISGAISSITTTIVNIFSTTFKNMARILNDGIAGVYQGIKLLITNPEHLEKGKLIKQALIVVTGAVTTSVGIILSEYLTVKLAELHFNSTVAELVSSGISAIVVGVVTAICVNSINNFGSSIKTLAENFRYAVGVSKQEILTRYQTTLAKIDDTYQEIIKQIYVTYDRLDKLGDLAHDLTLAANIQLKNTANYAKASGVAEEKVLRTNDDVLNFFNE